MKLPRPVCEMDATNIAGLFFDIDDTFSSHGKITAAAFDAIWRLKSAGKIVVPVTGRPAGWCDHIARMWPVDAVVGENGAFYFMMKGGKLVKRYSSPESKQTANREELARICKEVLENVPGVALASDQNYREFDVAFDFCEDVPRVGEDGINKVLEICKSHGAITKVSSIHINVWFGDFTKLSATKLFAKKELGLDLDKDNAKFAFCGDSPNDEPMFEFFKNSVGVANVMNFKKRLKVFPAYVTSKECGEGFAELAGRLMGKNRRSSLVARR